MPTSAFVARAFGGPLAALLASSLACSPRGHELPELPSSVTHESAAALPPLVLAHGGQGSPALMSASPAAAVERGYATLEGGGTALEAAIVAVELLEDDPDFNAGTGANLRIDGRTIETDAAVMTDQGHFGAVAGVQGIRHPVRLAERVLETPHLLIAGAGANALARRLGLEQAELATPQARARLERGYARLFDSSAGVWPDFLWRDYWNFEVEAPADLAQAHALVEAGTASGATSMPSVEPGPDTSDTVGVVVRTSEGRFAAALSTGGTTLALRGRIGDVPLLGDGLYAGPYGAVAATGKGEAIVREQVARSVYRHLEAGETPNDAIRLAIRDISPDEGVGVIAVSQTGWGALATSQMAWAAREGQQRQRADHHVQHDDR
jgi:isoaspartyl peptidase/L-asparaginase-like protein (Ntn-hydrolase superfamily)